MNLNQIEQESPKRPTIKGLQEELVKKEQQITQLTTENTALKTGAKTSIIAIQTLEAMNTKQATELEALRFQKKELQSTKEIKTVLPDPTPPDEKANVIVMSKLKPHALMIMSFVVFLIGIIVSEGYRTDLIAIVDSLTYLNQIFGEWLETIGMNGGIIQTLVFSLAFIMIGLLCKYTFPRTRKLYDKTTRLTLFMASFVPLFTDLIHQAFDEVNCPLATIILLLFFFIFRRIKTVN